MLIKNSWYVVANPEEIEGGTIVGRTILNKEIAIYRLPSGKIVIARDRCPHRFVPLSLGKLVGDHLQCAYHGAEFDATGACVAVPGQESVPANCRLEIFPARERYGFIWGWFGDPALAETTPLPERFAVGDDPDYAGGNGVFASLQANYALIADNLFDLTHADFVHPGSFSGKAMSHTYRRMKPGTAYVDGQMTYEVREDAVIARSLAKNQREDAMPFSRFMIAKGLGQPSYEGPVDAETEIVWHAPSFVALSATFRPSESNAGFNGTNLHAVTPETEHSSHYFYRAMRNFAVEPCETPAYLQAIHDIFTEDRAILEQQQARIGDVDLFDQPHSSFSGDIIQYKIRAILKRLEASEQTKELETAGR